MINLFRIGLKITVISIIVVQFSTHCIYGQESAEDHEEELERHGISLNFAYSFIPKGAKEDNLNNRGHFVPGIGIDYIYKLQPKWEVGLMVDIEFGSYVIPHKDDLERENALILAFVAIYKVYPKWNLLLGGGIELERHENFGILRVGTDYSFSLKNGWFVPLSLFFDIKEGFDTWSFAAGIGREF